MSVSGRGYVTCPNCRIPNPVGPSQCWSCGASLPVPSGPGYVPPSPDPSDGAPATPAAPAWSSGSEGSGSSPYAYSPGAGTSPEYVSGGEEYSPPGSDRWLTVGVIACAAVIAAVALIFVMAA